MENIRQYKAPAFNCEEIISVGQYPNGEYYIWYGEFTDGTKCPCLCRGFNTLEDVDVAIRKHRPLAIRCD